MPITRNSEQTSRKPNAMYYLKKTATTAMPSHEQNLELFKLLETARSSISELKANSATDPANLECWEKQANKVRNALIMANQGLVTSLVGKYKNLGLEEADLIQVGLIGLATAIEKFDYGHGCKLSTYAMFWIKQAMTRALNNQSRTIRIPEGVLAELGKLKKTMARLSVEYGCEPLVEEIAWEMNLPASKVSALLAMDKQTISMESLLGHADGVTIIDFIADSSAADPAEMTDKTYRREMLNEAIKTLTGREREVLELHYGFKDFREHTLEEIGRKFEVTRERIRQIKEMAEEKLSEFRKAKEREGLAQALKAVAAKNGKLQSASAAVKQTAPPVVKSKGFRLKMRSVDTNPNHHIWNNNGTWYCNFVLVTETGKESRVRNPLYTDNVEDARRRRDKMILLYNGLHGYSAA